MNIITTIILIGILSITAVANATAAEGRAEKRLDHISKRLDLNEQQQQQFREIMRLHQEQRKALHEERKQSINSILTAEQQEKFTQIQEKRKAKREERRKKRKQLSVH